MYRTSDLAEIVSNPSPITRRYLDRWFTGNHSYGLALKKIGWPYTKSESPLLVWDQKNGLRVDVMIEEQVLYGRTLFSYTTHDQVRTLRINPKKISLSGIACTFQAIWAQSKLLMHYQQTYDRAKGYIEDIPLQIPTEKIHLEHALSTIVWPNVIAVDYIGEYVLSILLEKKTPEEQVTMLNQIHRKMRDKDWYTHAILAWDEYEQGHLSKFALLQQYGYAAGDDYELTRPRYYERLHEKKPGIVSTPIEDLPIVTLEDLAGGMHYLRSEAKRKSLIWIDALRQHLIKESVIS